MAERSMYYMEKMLRKKEMVTSIYTAIKKDYSDIKGILDYLVLHCSLTPLSMQVTPELIRHWHMDPRPRGNGWTRVGYSDLLQPNGELQNMVPYDEDMFVEDDEMTWGAAGHNSRSRHICIIGGMDKNGKNVDTVTIQQKSALEAYIKRTISFHANIKIAGHCQLDPRKTCPNFNVPEFLRSINISEKHILS